MNEWKVYFDGSFWGHRGHQRMGRKIRLDTQLICDDEVWQIPAVYSCGKGLVTDVCVQVNVERIRSFMERWELFEARTADFADEQQMQMNAENPLALNYKPEAILNGNVLSCSHSCGISWNPCISGSGEHINPVLLNIMQHYGLDTSSGWVIRRAAFPWNTKQKPNIKSLSINLTYVPAILPGMHFRVASPGEAVSFIYPSTGLQHVLTVQDYGRHEMPLEHTDSSNEELPPYFTLMIYTLTPDLPSDAFMVTDCARSDLPRQKNVASDIYQAGDSGNAGKSIIGRAHFPIVMYPSKSEAENKRTACSALHFEPTDDVEWRMIFHEKRHGDIRLDLI